MKTDSKHVRRLAVLALVCSMAHAAIAGGRICHHCGSDKHVKPVVRLVKVCEEVELPKYASLKQEVFFPDKGAVCHVGYRCDTYCKIWRDCDCNSKGPGDLPLIQDPLQTSPKMPLPPLRCSCYTKSGCVTLFGAKPAGWHEGCIVRERVAAPKILVPLLKWETVPLCKDCAVRK
ncbi:MAG: hypothetical protein CMJ64_03280 [Planctomycetaceae bacterium]|nr:hypothetical protein [Planctomycetaceae bacterium]